MPATTQARYGWQKRPYSWEFSLSAQREIGQGVSVNGGYFRRWFGNFLVTDNLSVQASDYDPFSITPSLIPAPPASAGGQALPGDIITERVLHPDRGGRRTAGEQLRRAVGHALPGQQGDRSLERVRPRHQRQASARHHRPGRHEHRADRSPTTATSSIRPTPGNSATGRRWSNRLTAAGDSRRHRNVSSVSTCHVEQAWLTQLKFLGSFTIPKVDVQIGASYQNIPGIELSANYADLNSDIAKSLPGGRLAGQSDQSATRPRTCRSSPPQADFYDRLNQLDLRLGKILRYGRTRANVSLDLYNLFNKGTITGASFAYATWLAPSSVIAPRLMKVSLTFDF